MFEGQICYDGHIVRCFPIVSLNSEEYERLEPTLKEPKPADVIQLKGELLQPMYPGLSDHDLKGFTEWYLSKQGQNKKEIEVLKKEVHLNISLKFICVKEVVWSVLLTRTALFSIQGDTKVCKICV